MAQATQSYSTNNEAAVRLGRKISRTVSARERVLDTASRFSGPRQVGASMEYGFLSAKLDRSIAELSALRVSSQGALRAKANALAETAPRDLCDALPQDPWSRLALGLAVDLGADILAHGRDIIEADDIERAATMDDVRPLLKAKGVLWGRGALERYGVKGFSQMTPEQLAALHVDLIGAGEARA